MSRALRSASAIAFGAFVLGCSDPQSLDSGIHRAAIVNGQRSDEAEDAVVRVIVPSQEALCSGSLVAPNVVLTALHCVAYYDTFGTFGCDNKGVLTSTTPGGGLVGLPVEPGDVHIDFGALPDAMPDAYGVRIFGSNSTEICRNDIALVVLDRDLPVTPLAMRLERETVRGEKMLVVGYGQTDQPVSEGRWRRAGRNVMESNPDVLIPSRERTPPNTFVLNEGACQGDSGGPAISEETGAVAGVYSLSAGVSCTSSSIRNIYTRLDSFTGLVDRAFDYAGATKIVETDPGAAGSGSGGSAGESGLGGSDPGEGGRTASGGTSASGGDGDGQGGSEGGGTSNERGGSVGRGGGTNQSGGSDNPGEGSGSRRDSSCACRVAGMPSGGVTGGAGALGLALVAAVRRRRRLRQPT